MTDYQPVTSADLEMGNAAPPPPPDGAPAPDASKYAPIEQGDLAPTGPAGPTGEFAYKGIPAAAAKRFSQSNPLANIFGAGASSYASNFVANFGQLNDEAMTNLVAHGYGNYSGPGALLQHMADAVNSGATLAVNGVLAGIQSLPAAGGAVFGQTVKELGGTQTEADRAEREGNFDTMAALSDVGSQHGLAMEGAAKAASPEAVAKAAADEARQIADARAQAAAPGVWGHAYRVDDAPGGGLTRTPLGRLPTADEAKGQAATVAHALYLPPSTADLIHQTYLDTGRPPAEVLMDAQTNHGGVLDDLVAGKVPDAYPVPSVTREGAATTKPVAAGETAAAAPSAAGEPLATPPVTTEPTGVSKIGQSIEAKAIETGLTKGFGGTAGYDKITIADQSQRAANLINSDLDTARAVIRGEQPLPAGLKGTALIDGMEEYIKKNPDGDLAHELANSPLVTGTSEAAQEMRLAAERTPDSAAAKLQEIQQAKEKQAGGPKVVAARRAAVKQAMPEAGKVLLPKEELSWDRFLEAIKC